MSPIFPLALLLSSRAHAQDQGWDGHGFEPAADDGDLEDLLTTARPEVQTAGAFGVSSLFEYAESPCVLYERNLDTGAITETALLDNVAAVNVQAQAAFHERIAIATSVPVWLTTSSADAPQGAGLGDLRLSLPVTAWAKDLPSSRVLLGLLPTLDLPTGNADEFTGNEGVGAGALATGSFGNERWLASANLGVETMPRVDWANVRGGFRGIGAFGASYLASEQVAVRLEAIARPKFEVGEVPGRESPAEALGSVRVRSPAGWTATLGGSTAISPGYSAAAWRAFAGVGYHRGKDQPVDTDLDGLVDKVDACPLEPETFNGWQDEEGCPDALVGVTVEVKDPEGHPVRDAVITVGGKELGRTDDQGRLTLADLVPGTPIQGAVSVDRAKALAGEDFEGAAPETGEGLIQIQLDWLPGAVRVITRSNLGAILDSDVAFRGPEQRPAAPLGPDGEELFVLSPGDWTLLVSAESFGIERRKVEILPDQTSLVVIEIVLSPAVVETTKEEVLILQAVEFDFDKAVVKADSLPILAEVANNLLAYEQIRKVEVQGHTDSKGSDTYNRKLAQARVDAVLAILVEQGVSRDRLVAVGYGEACPIAENKTDAGRASNRRVQFMVTDPTPANGIPCHDGVPARRAEPTKVQTPVTAPAAPAPAPEAPKSP